MFAWGTATVRLFPVAPILRGESPAPLFQLTGTSHQFDCLEFGPDGSRLMAAGDSVLRLWETANGAELLIIHLKGGPFGSNVFSFSADGHEIWAGLDEKGQLWGWDASPLENEAVAP